MTETYPTYSLTEGVWDRSLILGYRNNIHLSCVSAGRPRGSWVPRPSRHWRSQGEYCMQYRKYGCSSTLGTKCLWCVCFQGEKGDRGFPGLPGEVSLKSWLLLCSSFLWVKCYTDRKDCLFYQNKIKVRLIVPTTTRDEVSLPLQGASSISS